MAKSSMSNEVSDLLSNALSLVNKNKNVEAFNIVQSILNNKPLAEKLDVHNWQYIGDISLICAHFDVASNAYLKACNLPGVAFSYILQNKLDEAEKILLKAENSPPQCWDNFLIDIFCERKKIRMPSFFQIRNFMEFTIYHLLLSKNEKHLQLLFKQLDKLLKINMDSEKLIGYAYFHFGKLDEAIKFLNNSINQNQFDGEIFYNLGQIYLLKNLPYEALSMLENARLLMPDHYPTCALIEKVQNAISSPAQGDL